MYSKTGLIYKEQKAHIGMREEVGGGENKLHMEFICGIEFDGLRGPFWGRPEKGPGIRLVIKRESRQQLPDLEIEKFVEQKDSAGHAVPERGRSRRRSSKRIQRDRLQHLLQTLHLLARPSFCNTKRDISETRATTNAAAGNATAAAKQQSRCRGEREIKRNSNKTVVC